MAVAIAITPASGEIEAITSVCRIDVTDATQLNDSTFDAEASPSKDPYQYRLWAALAGRDEILKSPLFEVNTDGDWTWDNLIFPEAGSWVVALKNEATGLDVATLSVTVS